jgi:hypothetical protein
LPEPLIAFIRAHLNDDVRRLAMQASRYPQIDMPFAVGQIAGRQLAKHKLPSFYEREEILYPPHLSLEQCSSELTAVYKATLWKGETLVDLTGGFGVDCAFMASHFNEVTYIEQNKALCDVAAHNFSVLGLPHIRVMNADAERILAEDILPNTDCIYADPARRDRQGGKTVQVSDCVPDVERLEPVLLNKARSVMIKLSPMLDLSLALHALPHTVAVHIVSVKNECKELLLMLSSGEQPENMPHPIHCINLISHDEMQTFTFTAEAEAMSEPAYTSEPAHYLYEPNASILKGGAFRSVGVKYGLKKLHPNSHLYTSNEVISDFPGRSFRVAACISPKDKAGLRQIGQANIAVRNYPLSVSELRKQTKLKEGGNSYIFATTLADESRTLIVCQKLNVNPPT